MAQSPTTNANRVNRTYAEAVDPATPRWRARGLAVWLLSHAWEHLSSHQQNALRALLDAPRDDEPPSGAPAGVARLRPRYLDDL